MKSFIWRRLGQCLIVLSAIAVATAIAPAQWTAKQRQNDINDATKTATKAAKAFNQIMGAPDNAIPQDLLDKAEAVAIFPEVINAAFMVGGRGGTGIISRRTSTGWSAPAFFKVGGGSFGAQVGAEKIDMIMLIMNDEGLQGLLKDKFELGGEASVAGGPVGRTASATTNALMDAAILSYSRSKGLFVGVSLKGTVINPDDDKNQSVYQRNARELLTVNSDKITIPSYVNVIPRTLTLYSRRKGKDVGH
jgi:lipid-binding SYLF domain-containing protein